MSSTCRKLRNKCSLKTWYWKYSSHPGRLPVLGFRVTAMEAITDAVLVAIGKTIRASDLHSNHIRRDALD